MLGIRGKPLRLSPTAYVRVREQLGFVAVDGGASTGSHLRP